MLSIAQYLILLLSSPIKKSGKPSKNCVSESLPPVYNSIKNFLWDLEKIPYHRSG